MENFFLIFGFSQNIKFEMSESEKKKPAIMKKWTPDEVRQLYQGNSDETKVEPYVKLRADDAFPCANIVHILIDGEWTDSQISKCSLCKPNTKVFLLNGDASFR